MNTLIYPVEYTAVVKSYSDWVNHENVEILNQLDIELIIPLSQ